MIAHTRKGHEILSYIHCDEPTVPEGDQHLPLTFTLVAAQYQDRYLLIYERERKQWEIPGGGIEPNEAAQDCARRELLEETGQIAEHITLKGLFKVCLYPDRRIEYGALYTASLNDIKPFVPNREVERILLWKPEDPLEEHLGIMSSALLKFC